MALRDEITFAINGKIYHVNEQTVSAETTLNSYIRDQAMLKGTKYMCREGNCGACVVMMQYTHPVTRDCQFHSVNSCLMPVLACHGTSITTVEGIGNKKIGYHPIQKNLAAANGSQCGYCSPGMVMSMFSLHRKNPNFSAEDVESSFGGHMCRCTGYRPILGAFKSLSNIGSTECGASSATSVQECLQCIDECDYTLHFSELALFPKSIQLDFTRSTWYKVATVPEIMQIFDRIGRSSYMILAGNTSKGLYPSQSPTEIYIDVRHVKDLQKCQKYKNSFVLGGNVTLAEAAIFLRKVAQEDQILFGYATILAQHIDQTANVSIRNVATIAGNLSVKHNHREFVSDVFLILETAGAKLKINELRGTARSVTLSEYLKMNMNKKLITSVEFPAISSNHYVLKTYKVMPRRQNSLSLLGAGFLFRILNDDFLIEEKPKIIFIGIHKETVRFQKAESIMAGKKLFDPSLIADVMRALQNEIQPDATSLNPSAEYVKLLACSLLYKFMIKVGQIEVNAAFRSGGDMLIRPISSSQQDYTYSEKSFPVGQPVPKLEALAQCSGEAEYVDDIPKHANEHFATFILAKEAAATIHSVDPSYALKENGIIAYYGPEDIPGVNSFGGIQPYLPEHEEIFCSGRVMYSGQPVGILVGQSREFVEKAAPKVEVKYLKKEKPLLNIADVILEKDASRIILQNQLTATDTKSDFKYNVEGELNLGSQYHYTLELPACLAVPTDFGLKVYPTSQWIQSVQSAVAQSLNLPENAIDVEVKRIGGGFGGKMTRIGQLAAACSLAAYKLNVPVRMVLDFSTNMKSSGKRCPVLTKYQAKVDDNGVIQKMNVDIYEDYGVSLNDPLEEEAMRGLQNCYDFKTWTVNVYAVKTDNHRTYCRGPGSLEGMASIERIMDHIAEVTGKDPVEVRLSNTATEDYSTIQDIINTVKSSGEYAQRLETVKTINKEHRWRKRGIALVPMKFMICFAPSYYGNVTIFPGDGSVAITTGGIEMGQGINTKAAQVCAFALGISLDLVTVVASRGLTCPGNFPSGSSITSDSICTVSAVTSNSYNCRFVETKCVIEGSYAGCGRIDVGEAILRCCEELKRRFEPLKEKASGWVELIRAANSQGVSLLATHTFSPGESNPKDYPVYGAAVIEVELDVLTGQYQILRADILEDAGESLNPLIDIGQIEGGFVMGLGYFSSESLICDVHTGENLTCKSSDYWAPGATDIPIDFRVTLRKNAPNPLGILRSKATGEPPLCMSCVLPSALRQAVLAARADSSVGGTQFAYEQPCTFEKTFLACGVDCNQFTL